MFTTNEPFHYAHWTYPRVTLLLSAKLEHGLMVEFALSGTRMSLKPLYTTEVILFKQALTQNQVAVIGQEPESTRYSAMSRLAAESRGLMSCRQDEIRPMCCGTSIFPSGTFSR